MSEDLKKVKQGYKIWLNPTLPSDPVKYIGEFYPPEGQDRILGCDLRQLGFGPGEYTVLAPPDRPFASLPSKWRKVTIPND